MEPMKVGLMGLGRGGRFVAKALLASSWCRLVAVGSHDSTHIEQFNIEHPDIATHNDFRSLVVSASMDALFVAVPPFLRVNNLALAAERGLPVWMLTPAARRFDEAVSILERFEAAATPIVVSRIWGEEPALRPDALGLDQAGRFFLGRGNARVCLEENFDWRGDSQRAGGGVVLYRAYGLIDIIVQAMGTPSAVYAVLSGASRPGTQFPYDTEDTAGLVCQYASGAIATISACWTAGPAAWSVELQGTAQSIHIESDHVCVRDRAGTTELARHVRPPNPFSAQVENFLSGLRSHPAHLTSTLRDHLATMAVIQAAYLSARTGQPESPGTIFEMHKLREPDRPKTIA